MRKGLLMVIFAVALTSQTIEAKKKKTEEIAAPSQPRLASEKDSASYAIGVDIGSDLAKNLQTLPGSNSIDMTILTEALSKVLKNDTSTLIINNKEARNVYQNYLRKVEKEAQQATLKKNKEWLENNKKNPSVVETPSGLQYEVIEEGKPGAAKPKATDKVKVNYKGTLTDGTVFDSSYDRGTPAEFELSKVIAGWTEGIQLMTVGSKFRFYIPSQLAYGERAMGKIKANSILIFDVELIDVEAGTSQASSVSQSTIGKYKFPRYNKNN